MITIVSGPSCAGKTTLLGDKVRMWFLSGAPGHPSTYTVRATRPMQTDTRKLKRGNWGYHYNTMRRAAQLERSNTYLWESHLQYRSDLAWRSFAKMHKGERDMRAVVLLVPREVLVDRIKARKWNDPTADNPKPYRSDYRLELLDGIDLYAMYYRWMYELDRKGIQVRCVDATTPHFDEVGRIRAYRFM